VEVVSYYIVTVRTEAKQPRYGNRTQNILACRLRLEDMRFIYETAADSTSVTFDCGDPFYDEFPWFRLVGR